MRDSEEQLFELLFERGVDRQLRNDPARVRYIRRRLRSSRQGCASQDALNGSVITIHAPLSPVHGNPDVGSCNPHPARGDDGSPNATRGNLICARLSPSQTEMVPAHISDLHANSA
jgi:hypothetical protein